MKNKSSKIVTKEGIEYEVPIEGSLGLLALGYKGIMAWREKRFEYKLEQEKIKEEEKKNG